LPNVSDELKIQKHPLFGQRDDDRDSLRPDFVSGGHQMDAPTTASRAAVRNTPKAKRWLGKILIGVVVLLGTGLVIAISIVWFGAVYGQEFSPHQFRRRSFFYYQVPLLRIQVSPITRTDQTGGLEKYLTQQKYVAVDVKAASVWDLVFDNQTDFDSPRCDARIVCKYLDASDADGNLFWLQWTKDQPQLAKILWPAVAKLAKQRLYIFVPELIQLVRETTDSKQLQNDLDQTLANIYQQLAVTQQQLGNHESAIQYCTQSLQHEPQNITVLRIRATSLQSQGKTDKAASDLDEAKKLGAEKS
jgi:hypothetical protein